MDLKHLSNFTLNSPQTARQIFQLSKLYYSNAPNAGQPNTRNMKTRIVRFSGHDLKTGPLCLEFNP